LETLVCLECYTIFDKSLLKKRYKNYMCPKHCSNTICLVEIDEGLSHAIVALNKNGISTLFSCFGHISMPYSNAPYISFAKPHKKYLLPIFEVATKLSKKYNIDVEKMETLEAPEITGFEIIHRFTVRGKRWPNDILERISYQSEFLCYLYELIEEVRNARKR